MDSYKQVIDVSKVGEGHKKIWKHFSSYLQLLKKKNYLKEEIMGKCGSQNKMEEQHDCMFPFPNGNIIAQAGVAGRFSWEMGGLYSTGDMNYGPSYRNTRRVF